MSCCPVGVARHCADIASFLIIQIGVSFLRVPLAWWFKEKPKGHHLYFMFVFCCCFLFLGWGPLEKRQTYIVPLGIN